MALPLSLSCQPDAPSPPFRARRACAHCRQLGIFEDAGAVRCPLCFLASHLERPGIDDEGWLIWLPEVTDQAVLSVLCREIHVQLRGLGERLHDGVPPRSLTRERERIYHVQEALSARRAAVVSRLDTDRPSDLAAALRQLPASGRTSSADLLAGLRLLPRGRFHDDEGEVDLYPELLEASIQASLVASARGETTRSASRGRP